MHDRGVSCAAAVIVTTDVLHAQTPVMLHCSVSLELVFISGCCCFTAMAAAVIQICTITAIQCDAYKWLLHCEVALLKVAETPHVARCRDAEYTCAAVASVY